MVNEIEYVPHTQINKAGWNKLIEAAPNGVAYAHANFLDAMSPGWDALIAGDYQAAMPLTWRKKLGIRYLCQPAFCQQLGVFSTYKIQPSLVESFLRKTVRHFRLIEIYLNEANHVDSAEKDCTNFLLNLNCSYEKIKSSYRNDLVKNLARTNKFHLQYVSSANVTNAIEQYRLQYGMHLGYRPQDYLALQSLCANWILQGKCIVREVYLRENKRDELLATALFIKDDKRIYNIASTTLPNGRTLEASHFLFDQLIQEFSGQDLCLDFEGSDLEGVARFYLKFSPENRPYFFWKSNRLPAVLRWWKR